VHVAGGHGRKARLGVAPGENTRDTEAEKTEESAAVDTEAVRAGHDGAPGWDNLKDVDRSGELPGISAASAAEIRTNSARMQMPFAVIFPKHAIEHVPVLAPEW
jgi:hypothetical protein